MTFKTPRFRQQQLVRSVSYPYRQHSVIYPPAAFPATARPSTNWRALIILLLGALLIAGGIMWLLPSQDDRQTAASTTQESKKEPEPEPIKQLDFTAMNTEINAVIAAYPGMDVGVAVTDIKTGNAMTYGVEEVFVAASTAKLLTAISYLHDVEQGTATLTQKVGARTAQASLEAMIVESDNQAWVDFNNSVMSHAELATYANSIGFSNYDPSRNTVTATSLARLLTNLYSRKLLNDQHTALLLSYMERAKEVEYIKAILPAGTKMYHKPGYLKDRVHDAAIIEGNNRPYVLVIFTKSRTGVYDPVAGEAVFQRIARSTFTTFLNTP